MAAVFQQTESLARQCDCTWLSVCLLFFLMHVAFKQVKAGFSKTLTRCAVTSVSGSWCYNSSMNAQAELISHLRTASEV